MIEIQRAEAIGKDGSAYEVYSLSLDKHLVLSKYYGDLSWILEVENSIKNLFPHLVNLSASEIQKHQDCIVLKAFVQHQEKHFRRYIYGDLCVSNYFDHDYNPSHYFNYEIPEGAIA